MAKERSPNYPAFGLGAAIGFAKKLYDAEGRSNAALEAVAKALGYSSVSGPVRSKVAAMRQYGLVDDAPQSKLRVSDRALRLVKHDQSDPEFSKIVREAALEPPLFAELHANYAGASDRNLEIQLEGEKGFSKDGAARVVQSYRETMGFAKLDNGSYDEPQDGLHDESDGKSKDRDEARRKRDERKPEEGRVYTIPALDGTDITVEFQKRPTPEVIDSMISVLQVMKPIWGVAQSPEEE